jgi:hypothetical protein
MRENKRPKRKVTRKNAKARKLMRTRRMVTNVAAAATTVKAQRRPRWKEPKLESQMMKMTSSRCIQDLQRDQ